MSKNNQTIGSIMGKNKAQRTDKRTTRVVMKAMRQAFAAALRARAARKVQNAQQMPLLTVIALLKRCCAEDEDVHDRTRDTPCR